MAPGACSPRGWAVAQQNKPEEGVAYIHKALAARRALGPTAALPWYLALLGEAYGSVGRFGDGLRTLEEAFLWVQHNEEHLYEAEVYRLKGELLLSQAASDMAEAEDCFQKALAVAACQQAKSWQLRAAISLGRLWERQDKRHDARELLAPIYSWFSEGFDTADLQDAKRCWKRSMMLSCRNIMLPDLGGLRPRATGKKKPGTN